ncbi:carbohydrate ABC transporter permease [Prosthecomicrobium pneumaticum]|uniref:Multiple sugar transport system permease protein n=1 Tax=Prosthecomicrobium pneumaticum TaxID=81895 RepID=A0A7W9CTT3_9HYPH|nr:carbohydrate ABC transporter permease [Prosthecomicrobium pneumaticum]MBB5751416.1 multiple sugar transport system permease protein [Prosthecomicrobium pneumaticum]
MNRLPARAGAAGLVGLTAVFFLLPIAYLVSVSFKTKDDVLTGSFLPHGPTLANWPGAFSAAPLVGFIGNSVLVATLSALVTVALTLPAAYAMIRLKVAEGWLPQATLASYMAPPVVALLPLFFLLKFTGLLNSQLGLALVYAFGNVPVAFWLLAPFLRRVPLEIEQAAAIDGAGPVRTLVSVVAPMVAPGIAATAIICGVLAYNEFLLASAFTLSGETRTLPVGLSLFQGDRLVNFGQIAAASLAAIAPVYLIALFMQRFLVEGLAHGGVK